MSPAGIALEIAEHLLYSGIARGPSKRIIQRHRRYLLAYLY